MEERVCSVNDLADGEMKEFRVGEKKILLCKLKGEFFATSPLCTHYKAPLVKGKLSEDGRIVCPWHGACFQAKDGSVEDAPAFDHLISFKVNVVGEDVFVHADQESLEAGRCVPTMSTHDGSEAKKIVIIGGGAAGYSAAATLREKGFRGQVVLVSKEPHLPIDRVKLSKSVKVEVEKILLRSQDFFDKAGIQVLLNQEVVSVDPQGKIITLKDESKINYDSLIIATGGNPRFFWGDINSFKNVFLLRGESHAKAIDQALEGIPEPNVVVVGSSFIGMEAAAVLSAKAKKVTVIGMEKVPFERVLGEKVGSALLKLHESKGIEFKMGAVVESFDQVDGRCISISLKGGEKVPCDFVIIGAGVSPATEFLKSSFNLEKDGSIAVDQHLRSVQYPDIFVAGDVARFPYPYKSGHEGTVRIEHWNVALQQGKIAAINSLGGQLPYTTVPFFWTAQFGKSIRYVGHALSFDEVHIEGSIDDLAFIAYYIKGDDVLAVASLGMDPACANASELIRLGKMPSASEIKSGKSVLHLN